MVLNDKYQNTQTHYKGRFARIFSTYWLVLLLIIVVNLIVWKNFGPIEQVLRSDLNWMTKLLLVFFNLFILGSESSFFFYENSSGGLNPTANFSLAGGDLYNYLAITQVWTLSLEILFYILAPFFIRSRRRIVLVLTMSIAVRIVTYSMFSSADPWDYRFVPSEFSLFCFGALLYPVYMHENTVKIVDKYHEICKSFRVNTYFIFILILVVHLQIAVVINEIFGQKLYFSLQLLPINRLFLLGSLIYIIPLAFSLTKQNSFDRMLGEYSFILYLVHLGVATLYLFVFQEIDFVNILIFSLMASALIYPLSSRLEKKCRLLLIARN
jgi:peptidoglycan/LPS O-acetylase OafA/YrhL